jgi:hypothetical protein
MTTLDQADLWLQANDPKASEKSEKYLLNKKIRDTHCLGAEFLEETTELTHTQEEDESSEAFLDFVERQSWLNEKTKILILGTAQGQHLSEIGQALGGISKQAVHKRLKKLENTVQFLLNKWRGLDDDPVAPGGPIPYLVESNHQLTFDFWGAA